MSMRRKIGAFLAALVLAVVVTPFPLPLAHSAATSTAESAETPQQYVAFVLDEMDRYGYYATGEQWRASRAAALRRAGHAPNLRATYPIIGAALKVAGGKHSHLWDPQEFEAAGRKTRFPSFSTTRGITTITLPELMSARSEVQTKYADRTAAAIAKADAAPGHCGFILDVRDNLGGVMAPMFAAISPLIPDGEFLGGRDRRDVTQWYSLSGGRVMLSGSTVFLTDDRPKVSEPIAVLYGDTASAGEASAIALVGLENTRSFGSTTQGFASMNQRVPLSDGAQAMITTAMAVDRTGLVYDERTHPALVPDKPTKLAKADDAAAAWIRDQCVVRERHVPELEGAALARVVQRLAQLLAEALQPR